MPRHGSPSRADKTCVSPFRDRDDVMDSTLRVLLVEDSSIDAELLVLQLSRGGFKPIWERVDTEEEMNAALDRQAWDAILSDHSMPCFSAPAALALLKARNLDVPFLIVSGAIGEDAAVAAMKAGAHDYVAKDHLARLAPALKRELREVQVRLEKRLAQEALRESEARYRTLVELSPDAVCVCQNGIIVFVNQAAAALLGAENSTAVLGRPLLDFAPPGGLDHARQYSPDAEQEWTTPPLVEDKLVRLDATVVDVEFAVGPVSWRGQPAMQLVIRDISERKRFAEERERHIREIERAQCQIEEQADMLARLSEDLALAHHEADGDAKAKSRLLAGTSLEIRAGLNGIVGTTSLLLDTELASQRQRDLAEAVRGNGESLLDALNAILNYFAMEAGELNLDMDDFDLRALLVEATALPATQVAERGVALIAQLGESVPNYLRGDALRLGQVLTHLAGIADAQLIRAVRLKCASRSRRSTTMRLICGSGSVAAKWRRKFGRACSSRSSRQIFPTLTHPPGTRSR